MIRARQESLASAQQASQQIEEEIARDQEYNGDAEPGSLDEITKMLAPKAQAAEERARSDAAANEASRQVAAAEDELKRVQLDAEGACRAFVLGCCIRTLVTQCCLDVCVTLWVCAQRTPAPPVFDPLCLWILIVTAPAEHCCLVCHAAASRAEQQAAIARAQQSLEDAEAQRSETEKKRNELRKETAALIDAKTATKLVDAGATKNAQGLALLIGLLRERLEELRRLPQLEKEARKLLRRVRRAERVTVRITLMLRALRNRHDEAIEFAEISSGA